MTDKQPNIQWLRDENSRLQEQVLALQHIADRDEEKIERLQKLLKKIGEVYYDDDGNAWLLHSADIIVDLINNELEDG
jgi:hypothetical protein